LLIPLHPPKLRYFKLVQLWAISSTALLPIEQLPSSRCLSFGQEHAISVIHRSVSHMHELRLRCNSFGQYLAISIIGILVKPLLLSRMRKCISRLGDDSVKSSKNMLIELVCDVRV